MYPKIWIDEIPRSIMVISTLRSSLFIVQSNHNHRTFKNRNQISLRQSACRSLNFDIWVLTKVLSLLFVLSFRWSPPFPCKSKGHLNDFMVHATISRDFSKISIVVLIFWRKYANILCIWFFAEKEMEKRFVVLNTVLVSDRPAKLRVRAPSTANYALRLLTKAKAECIRE